MTEIIRLQTVLTQELSRRFERSAALAFSDIVDSTRYFAQHGDEAGRRLQQLQFDLLEQCLPQHNGRVVGTAGDGAFLIFPAAGDAASALVAFQRLACLANQDRQQAHQIAVRIGMHWGRVLTDGDQVTGDSVNLCARIASTAQPGQIRVSRDMFQQLSPQQRMGCRGLEAVALKGISRSVELLEMPWREPSLFPHQILVHESGALIWLPQLDTLCFGRGETVYSPAANDVILTLADATASRQISRRHFELLATTQGYLLKALSNQATEVDGVAVQRDQEVLIRPGSLVRLAGGMTLEFVSPGADHPSTIDETMVSPGLANLRAKPA